MNDDLNDNLAEPPKSEFTDNPSRNKLTPEKDVKSDSKKNNVNHKPRIKGSHRDGNPPKLKWL